VRLVLANGCFDLLHVGHLAHLEEARSFGDELWVALTADEHVNKGPGRPILPWAERAALLGAIRFVDRVFPSRHSVEAIERAKPAVFAKGVDYVGSPLMEPVRLACARVGCELRFTRTPKVSTSDLIKRIKQCA